MSDVIHLRTLIVGERPWVLVEMTGATLTDTGDIDTIRTQIEAGGGLSEADLIELLRMVVDEYDAAHCSCGRARWVDDENWQPEQWELRRGRIPGSGRIPCGLCNHGGWDVPDGGGQAAGPGQDQEARP